LSPTNGARYREQRDTLLARPDLRGGALCAELATLTDAWLIGLFAEAVGENTRGMALVAAGGYGRAELAPGSDLDVWLVHRGGADVARVADRVWYPVWDEGVTLGHAVRTVRQALALAGDDLDTATALLDLRHLAGDGELSEDLAARSLDQWRRRWRRFLPELDRRGEERHAASGDVAFLLEPELKEGKGGLRDVHVLRWVQRARPVLREGDDDALDEAYRVLLAVRVELHRATGKASDQLLLERQDEVADALGETDADALMANVASAARTVAWIGDEAWQRLHASLQGPLGRVFRRDRPLDPGLFLREGEIHIDMAADWSSDPTLVLRAAAAAAQARTRIDRASLDRLAREAPVLDGAWPDGARDALVDLLATGSNAIDVMEALDQRRLMERVLPEWAAVRSLPQRNAYHRFTVDRHLCETAANATALISRVARPDLLLVAALLHDLGKGYPPRDHTEVGVELVQKIGPRMGFPPHDVEVLVDLVRHHLLLADAATRRDLEDDRTVQAVADALKSLDVLELLAALTEADSIATGSSAWGPWKAELVNRLVSAVAHVLRGGAAEDMQTEGFPTPELEELMRSGTTVVRAQGSMLTVVAPDRPGLFSLVAGALSLSGLGVLAADAHSSEDGVALSVFRVEPTTGGEVDWHRVVRRVREAVQGELPVAERLSARTRSPGGAQAKAAVPARLHVHIDNHASDTATVVEIWAPDDAGVLYRMTRAMADLGLDIRHAKIQTLGHQVVDSFYVRGPEGGKVVSLEEIRTLDEAVRAALGEGAASGG